MRKARTWLIMGLAFVMLGLPAGADVITNILFGTTTLVGIVNSVSSGYFTIIEAPNVIDRIMVPQGYILPQNIMLGVKVEITVSQNQYGQWVLESLDAADPVMAPPNGGPPYMPNPNPTPP